LLAEHVGVNADREPFLLARLGGDLPGNVRVTTDDSLEHDDDLVEDPSDAIPEGLKFSLAGMQLKFSAMQTGRGFTLPVTGSDGDWIVKLPDARFSSVPENEWSMMQWARESGIDVPEVRLVPVRSISRLPPEVGELPEQLALAVRRFDRGPGQRIHIEDFAQVRDTYPERKYQGANFETLARLMLGITGTRGYEEFVRRLVFIVASGNGDSHLKNWSLIYRDGINAELAPAYDLVATTLYMPDERLALNLARSKRFEDVSVSSFSRLAEKAGSDAVRTVSVVRESVHHVRTAWRTLGGELRLTEDEKARLERRWSGLPLMSE
jgi:serine/threonine-protein kinase HipA